MDGNGMMLEPTTSPDEPREIGVPEIVIAGPFLETLVLAMEKTSGTRFESSSTDSVAKAENGDVLVPITSPDGPRETGVPVIVMGGPFFETVLPAMDNTSGAAPVGTGSLSAGRREGRIKVVEPTARPTEPRETGVPERMMGGPPRDGVIPPIMSAEGSGLKVFPATVRACGDGSSSGSVDFSTTSPEGPSEIGVPETVMGGPFRDTAVPAIGNTEGFGVNVLPATV